MCRGGFAGRPLHPDIERGEYPALLEPAQADAQMAGRSEEVTLVAPSGLHPPVEVVAAGLLPPGALARDHPRVDKEPPLQPSATDLHSTGVGPATGRQRSVLADLPACGGQCLTE